MSLRGFETLECPKCQKTKVVQLFELIWQEGKGQTTRIAGYQCATCQEQFDGEAAIRAVKKKHMNDKIKEMEADL